jgi:hypothetical protein
MTIERKYSSHDVAVRKFSPHGRVEFTVNGNILKGEATGPFNPEFISAVAETEFKFVKELSQRGKWVELIEIRHSALASQETLAAFSAYLSLLVEERVAPSASAYVIAQDVEGGDLMAPLIAACYANANLEFRKFEQVEDAMSWLEDQQ